MTVAKTDHRSIVALKLPTRMQALITYANGIVKGLTGNPSFPTVIPSIVTISAAIADLQTAETAALARTKGAVVTRDEKKTALVQLLQQLKGTIQTTADANLENGASIIASAGVAVRRPTPACGTTGGTPLPARRMSQGAMVLARFKDARRSARSSSPTSSQTIRPEGPIAMAPTSLC